MSDLETFISQLPGETDKAVELAEVVNRLYPASMYLLVIQQDGQIAELFNSKQKSNIVPLLRDTADQFIERNHS